MDDATGNLCFMPVKKVGLRLFRSAMLRNPQLWQVALVNRSAACDDPTSSAAIDIKHDLDGPAMPHTNFLHRTHSLDIRHLGERRVVVGRKPGSLNTAAPYAFTYSIATTPQGIRKSRSGERWVTPLAFECPAWFFYPRPSAAQKIARWMHYHVFHPPKRAVNASQSITGRHEAAKQSDAVQSVGSDDAIVPSTLSYLVPHDAVSIAMPTPLLS